MPYPLCFSDHIDTQSLSLLDLQGYEQLKDGIYNLNKEFGKYIFYVPCQFAYSVL